MSEGINNTGISIGLRGSKPVQMPDSLGPGLREYLKRRPNSVQMPDPLSPALRQYLDANPIAAL